MRNRNLLKAGFTLIELVLVIIIIGVLAAIIVPRFVSQVQKSEEATAQANLTSLRSALDMVVAKSKGLYPDTVADLETAMKDPNKGAMEIVPRNNLLSLSGAYFKLMAAKPVAVDVDQLQDWIYYRSADFKEGKIYINKTEFWDKW